MRGLLVWLVACAPSLDELSGEVAVEALDDTDEVAPAGTVYALDPEVEPLLGFEASGLFGIPARGVWERYSVRVVDPGTGPEGYDIRVIADLDSLRTGVARLDEHIRTSDFMDVATYPEARFRSASVRALDPGRVRVEGDLTLRGTTRRIAFDALLEVGDSLATQAEIPLSRWDFGLVAEGVEAPGGDGASDTFVLRYDLRLVRETP